MFSEGCLFTFRFRVIANARDSREICHEIWCRPLDSMRVVRKFQLRMSVRAARSRPVRDYRKEVVVRIGGLADIDRSIFAVGQCNVRSLTTSLSADDHCGTLTSDQPGGDLSDMLQSSDMWDLIIQIIVRNRPASRWRTLHCFYPGYNGK